ncbi:hypothetical protein I7X12_01260 [Halosimplex litoreum]|uniref:Uncharacterized protein n=1 Tax=Halosimplex litoreum TaxID=1198301 RepID=A0A7T3FYX9_9EURY|nr:hypothetical protein [Halosimplex litoreum]QPV63290.1 hypothetical protein I7X12_01260 [Halosimplex litoreum]
MSDNNGESEGISRRNVLRSVGAAGAAAATGLSGVGSAAGGMADTTERGSLDAEGDRRTVTVDASGEASYEFSVSGVLVATDAPEDAVDAGAASASLTDGAHTFEFTGEFTAFDLAGDARVRVDGEPFYVDSFPRQTVEIAPSGSVSVDISASGRLEAGGGGRGRRTRGGGASGDGSGPLDRVNDRTLRGTISSPVTLSYAGELTHFEADGDVRVRKNGDVVDAAEVLPSAMPGGVTVSGSGQSFAVETSDRAEAVGTAASAEDGTVTGTATEGGTEARFDGNLLSLSQGDATATISVEEKRVICSAPADGAVEFTIDATDAILYEDAAHETLTTTVSAGSTERIKFLGDVTALGVGGVTAEFDPVRYPEAGDSARLQAAAAFERTDAYDRAAAQADGRVRHDADGIYTVSYVADGDRTDSVVYRLTDVGQGDEATVTLSRRRRSGDVTNVENTYQWKTSYGTTSKVKAESLALAGAASVQSASFETTTAEYDVSENGARAASQQVEAQGLIDDATDFLGDIWDGLTDVAGDVAGLTGDMMQDAIEAAPVDMGELAVTSGQIVCNSITALQDLATELINTKYVYDVARWEDVDLGKVLWKVRLTGYDSIVSIATSQALGEFGDGDWSCGACISVIRLVLDVGICGFGVGAFCAGTNWWNLGLGAAPCTIALGAVCSYAVTLLPDAKEMCSYANEPTGWEVC